MNKLRIGICGWGNVATGLFRTLETNHEEIKKRGNLEIEIIAIGARRDNPKCDPGNVIIERDIFKIIDHEIDVIVELIGGVDVARDLILKALNAKKHVVTANKALIAKYGDKLSRIAENNKVNLEFEAAVCGGVPIIRSLKEGLISTGCFIEDIGLSLSPMVYFSQFKLNADAIAMVTASHNENGWTGVKMGIKKGLTHGPEEMMELKEIKRGVLSYVEK